MHGRMNQDCLAVSLSQSPDRCLTAVRGAVVHNPENTAGRSVRLTPHHLIDQSAERVDSGLILLVWQTASQAVALTIARSRGGKGGLASAARSIGQGEVTACPTVPPALDGMGVQFDQSPGCDVR